MFDTDASLTVPGMNRALPYIYRWDSQDKFFVSQGLTDPKLRASVAAFWDRTLAWMAATPLQPGQSYGVGYE
jgi:hypothetical protein